jgi:hypothetical protein
MHQKRTIHDGNSTRLQCAHQRRGHGTRHHRQNPCRHRRRPGRQHTQNGIVVRRTGGKSRLLPQSHHRTDRGRRNRTKIPLSQCVCRRLPGKIRRCGRHRHLHAGAPAEEGQVCERYRRRRIPCLRKTKRRVPVGHAFSKLTDESE